MRLLLAFVAAFPGVAGAHDWYDGKVIPGTSVSCCNGRDCHRVTAEEFERTIRMHPEIKVQPSEDEAHHVCVGVYLDQLRDTWGFRLRCAFAPMMGY